MIVFVLLTVAVLSTAWTAREILRGILDQVSYLGVLDQWHADRAWWLDARFSLIPAEQHAAVETVADVYGLVPVSAR